MKILSVSILCLFLACFGLTGCEDECEKACAHLEACGFTVSGSCECETSADECYAKCINSLSCDELEAGGDSDCIYECI